MKKELINSVLNVIRGNGIPIIGVASAEKLDQGAPEGFRPGDLLPGAKSVVIFARPLPLSVFLTSVETRNGFYVRSFLNSYQNMDHTANSACLMLEEAGFKALPIPAYSPIRFHRGEPAGMISMKHAAVEAGIGVLGKNTLLINPEFGNTLRLGGIITTAPWPAGKPDTSIKACPDGCSKCLDACPVKAFKKGPIDKSKCMGHCIEHVMLPPKFMLPLQKWIVKKSRTMTRLMELIALNFFESYGIRCIECLKACPHFIKMKKKLR